MSYCKKSKYLVEQVEVRADMPFHIDTEFGSVIVTINPVKDKFRTYDISVEYIPVNGIVMRAVNDVRKN